jgi:hypothetical protein
MHYPLELDMSHYNETNCTNGESKANNRLKVEKADDLSLYEPEFEKKPENEDNIYELFAVIIHCGKSGNYGHYHAYIRDLLQQGTWNLASEKRDESDAEESKKKDESTSSGDSTSTSTSTPAAATPAPAAAATPAPTTSDATPASSETSDTAPAADSTEAAKPEGDAKGKSERVLPEANSNRPGWYDFNDSSVAPISEETLRSQFGGQNECACEY